MTMECSSYFVSRIGFAINFILIEYLANKKASPYSPVLPGVKRTGIIYGVKIVFTGLEEHYLIFR
jgi:hypothetical protein